MDLGKRFKRFREKRGLTQNQAAELIGVNNYQIGNYETNRSEPSIAILKKMSEVYDVSIDTLVGNFAFTSNEAMLKDPGEMNADDMSDLLLQISEALKNNNNLK